MHILAIDQGTTGTTTVVYDKNGEIIGKAYREFTQIFPQPGWVEHDPMEIWQTVIDTVREICSIFPVNISAIGITNQRETTVVWDKNTGKPIYNAIVWQCRRTSEYCEQLKEHKSLFQTKTGLPIDAYFSGTKIKWLLENCKDYKSDDILFGTIDSWLIWKLTNGAVHATDFTNASRTLIFNIQKKKWDPELCDILNIPLSILPTVKKSIDDYGKVKSIPEIKNIPIYGVAGDQQAALFGQTCFHVGQTKNTYGTGCFLMMNTGQTTLYSDKGLLTTIAIDEQGNPCYALEASIFIAGAAIQWLRDGLELIKNAAESEQAAEKVNDNNGVYLVPAFVGLGAPHWNMQARGTIVGITRGATKNHIIRAALESIAYQTYDVLKLMEQESNTTINTLIVDGGAVANNFLMQFQSDITNKSVLRPKIIESTSLGAAFLAGLKAKIWKNSEELINLKQSERVFKPSMPIESKKILLNGWQKALRQTMVK